MQKDVKFEDLKGKTLAMISGGNVGSDEMYFITDSNEKYMMYHDQD